VVTHQLQVERRTAKAHWPKTDAIPLDHVTNLPNQLLVGQQEGHPACKKWGMVEVGTAWSGWSGAQPDCLCVCLC